MSKKVAILVPEVVNGYGLFAYIEAFFEAKVECKTFAISKSNKVKTNSGYEIVLDDTVDSLVGRESEYSGVVFACGDSLVAFDKFSQTEEFKKAVSILKAFNTLNKPIAGHCAAAIVFDIAGIDKDKKVAVHPLGKAAIKNGIAVDNSSIIDRGLFTAKCEHHIGEIVPMMLYFL